MKILKAYKYLRPGMCIGVTKLISPLGAIIRATTAGFINTFNPQIASHIVCVAESKGLLYGVEMNYPKIRRVDLNDLDPVVFVGYHPDLDQSEANDWLWESHARRIKYGILEVLEFWGLPTDQPKRMICSELYKEMLKAQGLIYPKEWDVKVSPYDIQKYIVNI